MALLSVERLSVTYRHEGRSVPAVDGISFELSQGEILALVGESGSGKSSVALALTRLLPALTATISGRVLLEGRDLLAAPEADLQRVRGGRVAYVFQDPAGSLNPVLTIGAQLIETIERHTGARGREAAAQARESLARVGLASLGARLRAYPHELSGGMQQRVMIAMALACAPMVLVADEPTTALDVTIQVQILRLLRDLQRRLGLSVLLISHDLTVVERVAHRVGVMAAGRLVEIGETTQVLEHPSHPHAQELLRYRAALRLRRQGGAG